ncbi:mannitol-1-phosphate dehydrogenase M1PDH1 [Guyanagaster necrorhizus]|uniref:alcohol dehydrogenase n=1 Tax=Guyanagaster necrorhizus TaxID=856835 RepID=A0A9P8AZ76_9AGAR|nr:mannitol-1-phosphate dehydrogenase M1PDH1 [Guyanagaster necrorhizus MCA 3950]KAG7453245.1 mannitol-1-phosphate dehydrogenase M1PDH1 [Guyanagaster necrorhizus MCA 3950]
MSIPQTARAAVIVQLKEDLVLRNDYPVKQPEALAPGECLIKLEYAGCCHSDLHAKNGDWLKKPNIPVVAGHEGVGCIVAIGPNHSPDVGFKVGDRVGTKWVANACLKCEQCYLGNDALCTVADTHCHGFRLDGAFADYIVSFVDYVTPIPDELPSDEAAPILCAGLTVYRALKESRARIGNWIAISGAGGGLGHLAIQYAVAMGLRVIAIDTSDEKRDLCLSLGAETFIDFMKGKDLVEEVKHAAGGLGPHAALLAVGDPRPFNQALMYLRKAGTMVSVGMPPGQATLNVPIALLVTKGLKIVGSATGNQQDTLEALDLAARGKVKCHFEVKDLTEVNNVFADMEAGRLTGRIVFKI